MNTILCLLPIHRGSAWRRWQRWADRTKVSIKICCVCFCGAPAKTKKQTLLNTIFCLLPKMGPEVGPGKVQGEVRGSQRRSRVGPGRFQGRSKWVWGPSRRVRGGSGKGPGRTLGFLEDLGPKTPQEPPRTLQEPPCGPLVRPIPAPNHTQKIIERESERR